MKLIVVLLNLVTGPDFNTLCYVQFNSTQGTGRGKFSFKLDINPLLCSHIIVGFGVIDINSYVVKILKIYEESGKLNNI